MPYIHLKVSQNRWNELKRMCKKSGITVRDGFKDVVLSFLKCTVNNLKDNIQSSGVERINGAESSCADSGMSFSNDSIDNYLTDYLTDIINTVNEENSIMKLLQYLMDLYSKDDYYSINEILQLHDVNNVSKSKNGENKPFYRYNPRNEMLYIPDNPIIDVRVYVDESTELFINTLVMVIGHSISEEDLIDLMIKNWKTDCCDSKKNLFLIYKQSVSS